MIDALSVLTPDQAPNFRRPDPGCNLGLLAVAYTLNGYEVEPGQEGGLIATIDHDLSDHPFTVTFEHDAQGMLRGYATEYWSPKPTLMGGVPIHGYERTYTVDESGNLQEDVAWQYHGSNGLTKVENMTREDWLSLDTSN